MSRHTFEPDQEAHARIIELKESAVLVPLARPQAYVGRMILFLAVVGGIAIVLHEHAYHFFLRNPPLNSLIFAVLILGIWRSFRAVSSLDPEITWIEHFQRDADSTLSAAPPPLMAPLAAMWRDKKGRVKLSAAAMRGALDGIDNRLDGQRETLRYFTALLIFLGLLGTFWGLLLMANSVGETIRSLNVGAGTDPAQMFETLRAGLEGPLSGMGTAFSTSLFGLSSSLVLGFLDLQVSQAQNRFANEVETWLTSLTSQDGGATTDSDAPAPSYIYALLENTAESFDRLQARMDRGMEESASVHTNLRALGDRLVGLTDELRRRDATPVTGTDNQAETVALLKRIAHALENRSDRGDDAARAHVRNIDLAVTRLVDESGRGRDHALAEIRNEIRLLARTLSVIADRER